MKVDKQTTYIFKLGKKKTLTIKDNNGKLQAGVSEVTKSDVYFDNKELRGLYEALKEVFGDSANGVNTNTTNVEDKTSEEIMSDEQARELASQVQPQWKPPTWVGTEPQ
jgi:hypothetical protein